MSQARRGNLLVAQGGGPTPVLNASLYGVIDEARAHFERVIGARFGVEGLIRRDLCDLTAVSSESLERMKNSPGATLGSTRYRPTDDDLQRIIETLREHDARALLIIGGNGSLRGAAVIADAVSRAGCECCVVGVPKTIDNDIAATDRCPGFGSAARYVAQSVRDLAMDVRALPQPVSLFETMGRSVGWLAGASILAKRDEIDAPHLIYLPETPFDTAKFVAAIDRVVRQHGWAVAVMTEGLKDGDGMPVYETAAATQRDALNRALPGGVSSYLADVITRELGIRCRWEKPGLCGRASMLHVSLQDQRDAEAVGRAGVRAALDERHGHMISLLPLRNSNRPGTQVIPLSHAASHERMVPAEFLTDDNTSIAQPFIEYVRPLVGELIDYAEPLKDRLGTLNQSVSGQKI